MRDASSGGSGPSLSEPLQVHDPNVRIDLALKAPHGKFITALGADGHYRLAGISGRILGWENFTLLRLGNSQVALKTAHGRYVTANGETDGWALQGTSSRILGWEVFTLVEHSPDRFYLRSAHGRYVRCGGEGDSWVLCADACEPTDSCLLTQVRI